MCLAAEGANQFAESMGIPQVQQESLITDYARMRWRQNLAPDANPVECQMWELTFYLLSQYYIKLLTDLYLNGRIVGW